LIGYFACSSIENLSGIVSNYFLTVLLGNISRIVFKSATILFSIAADNQRCFAWIKLLKMLINPVH